MIISNAPISFNRNNLSQNLQKQHAKDISCAQKVDTFNPSFGSRKIPKFLYHFTNGDKYQSILKEGMIRPNSPHDCINGVYMVSLQNFLTNWVHFSTSKVCPESNLALSLFERTLGYSGLTLLKVPTDTLDGNKLLVRSQNQYISRLKEGSFNSTFNYKLADFRAGKTVESEYLHSITGDKAVNARKYTQRGDAIEYICTASIPISSVSKVGVVEFKKDMVQLFQNHPEVFFASTLKTLLKGTPEEKALVLLRD